MDLYEKILAGEEKLSLVGLGYVGMPIAVAFARKIKVIGYDLNAEKIKLYQSGIDPTNEVGDDVIRQTEVEFTADETKLREAKFHIVAVPTPVNDDHTPDLTPVEGASRILGRNLTKGSVVVFESTVYPGVTEEVCVPILEKESGLVCGKDFKIGYSPERINPGDKVHRLETITKIVSGMDEETLDTVAKVYELVVEAGVYRAESIQVAEAAKVIENSQRDINIAFMNELSIIFNKMGIDTQSVLKAAGTKWNFLKFYPGLVGGHSGVEINKGRANANVLMGRLLRAMAAVTELRLVSAEGGSKGNAIPTAAAAVVTVADGSAARKAAETLAAEMKKEYRIADPGLTVAVETVETKSLPMDEVTTGKALCMLTCLPNGVQAMSMDIPGLVQTSLNVGILKCGDDELTAVCSVRSSVASQKQMVRDRLRCLTEQLGGRVDVVGDYPAWEYLPDSPLRERMIEVYREQYGKEPVVETVHAGLECGLLGEKLPGLDCVSFGPDLTDIHTPRERMHIASVQRTWKLLCEVLKRSK